MPYAPSATPEFADFVGIMDPNGVPLQVISGRAYYKPAGLAQLAVSAVEGYRMTKDARFLDRAVLIATTLKQLSRRSQGALYIPYLMDFAMHQNRKEVLKAPWYSAMAQGLIVSVWDRLYLQTGDPEYLANARSYFLSLRHLGRGTTPWVTYVDAHRYLWFEEYPERTPDHTLNGFNFALFGAYDHWLASGDPYALQLLRGALTTMRHYAASFRNPRSVSDYCLKHGRPQLKYHRIHIWQFAYLGRISGDRYFAQISALLTADHT